MPEAWRFESAVPNVAWPALPSLGGARTLALLHQLDESQWLDTRQLAERQAEQLEALLAHAHANVRFYAERWPRRPRAQDLQSLPLLSRRDLQTRFSDLRAAPLPGSHGGAVEAATSGTTGSPVRILRTGLNGLFWNALTLREHVWHERDLSLKLAILRTNTKAGRGSNWGAATSGLVRTGPVIALEEERERDEQIRWLERERPDIVFTHASNAFALARRSLALGAGIRLKEVRTFGDMLDPAARELCARAWGAKLTDVYSAVEVGYIALQCPQSEHYHVQAESVLVEVLDEAGKPCRPGETGRVVITDLHNFAMPLIRYEIGDGAAVGEACACGRGLPVLKRIAGRTRNLMRAPDGRTYWPYFGSMELAYLAPVRSHQFAQKAPDLIELRLVCDAPLSPAEEEKLRAHFMPHLPAGVGLQIRYVERFPGSEGGGKYEYFVSELPGE